MNIFNTVYCENELFTYLLHYLSELILLSSLALIKKI